MKQEQLGLQVQTVQRVPQDRREQRVSQVLLAQSAPSAQVVRLVQPVLLGPQV
ncbi:MAG: hypothetical protein Q8S32_10845 [Burkholderiaceae bacterium]|nr:hypothetical protein [Burkholderiaceae bacterium]